MYPEYDLESKAYNDSDTTIAPYVVKIGIIKERSCTYN
jgi:hypothetical protein